MKTHRLRIITLLPVLALSLAMSTRVRATEATANAEANTAEVKGDAAKIALKELDAEIDRVDAMIDHAPTPADKAAAKARMDVLKESRSELRGTYMKARYDELMADVRAEADHAGTWTKQVFTRDPAQKAADEANDTVKDAKEVATETGNNTYAHVNSADVATDIAAYKLRPTDTNKEEAKAALKALSQKIDELGDRADQMQPGSDRELAKQHIKALKDREDTLQHDFNKARFDALIDDVKNAWN